MAMEWAKTTSLLAVAIGVALSLASCSQRARRVDVQPDPARQQQPPGTTPPGQGTPGEDGEATIAGELDLSNVKTTSYVIPDNADWTYRWSFLAKDGSGSLLIRAKKATVEIKGLSVGQVGDLRFEALDEQNKLRLKGEAPGLNLKAGRQAINLNLREVADPDAPGGSDPSNPGAGNDQTADLVLNISVEEAQGGSNQPPASQQPGAGNRIAFTEIAQDVRTLCGGCHGNYITEAIWAQNKADFKRRIENGSMPKAPVAAQMSAAQKAKMLTWLSQ